MKYDDYPKTSICTKCGKTGFIVSGGYPSLNDLGEYVTPGRICKIE